MWGCDRNTTFSYYYYLVSQLPYLEVVSHKVKNIFIVLNHYLRVRLSTVGKFPNINFGPFRPISKLRNRGLYNGRFSLIQH